LVQNNDFIKKPVEEGIANYVLTLYIGEMPTARNQNGQLCRSKLLEMICNHKNIIKLFFGLHTTFISRLNIMFISAESASDRNQLQLASPAIITWRRLNPNRNGVSPTGMRVLASSCGDMYVDLTLLGLNWALTLKWNAFPSKSSKAKVRRRTE
jgi:hypothetical protein